MTSFDDWPKFHVVIRVDRTRSGLAPQDLRRPPGDHLVGVRVGRCARPGLEDVEDELMVEAPLHHLVRCHPHCVGFAVVEVTLPTCDLGCGALISPSDQMNLLPESVS